MVRHSALKRTAARRAPCATWVLPALCFALTVQALEPVTPPKPDVPKTPAGPEKPKGPEHNVTLMEEHGVTDLFNKAAKARARAEKEPEAWPECVKCYADILKKYPNTVYLDKWESADKEHALTAYKNGLYKSTRERVAAEIASLPPAALTVYRVINESSARSLYLEGQEQFDEHKMEQVARDYFQTSWGNDALAWLGEFSVERGAWRDAAERFRLAAANPGNAATPMSVLVRMVLAQSRLGDKAGALKTFAEIQDAAKDPAKGALRVGADEGDTALAKLKTRVDSISAAAVTVENADANGDWTTYFGNAAHTQLAQPRPARGLRKWSMRINDLLYGKNAVSGDIDRVINDDGSASQDSSINQQLTVKDGYFYLNDAHVYAAYPVGNPLPGSQKAGGSAKFQLPAENVAHPPAPPAANPNANRNGMFVAQPGIAQHPFFATLAGEYAYGVLGGAEALIQTVNMGRFFGGRFRQNNGDEEKPKGPSNYIVCFGRAENGRETTIVWSLKPGEPAFLSQSKADQEWLKTAYFTSSPTYESGVLYSMAVIIPGNADGIATPIDAWATAVDAENGRLLWKTQICTATSTMYSGRVQPDRGLPVAVSNRVVYVVTNLGAVAALDAGGGTVKWIRVYDRAKTTADQMGGGGEIVQSQEFWAPNPPIVYKNRLIATPQDSDTIYGYDLETGARAWQKSRLGDQETGDVAPKATGVAPPSQSRYKHVLGIVNGALAMTGTDILFVNALNGKNLTDPYPVEGTIRGRGAVTANMAWISTDKELWRFDISNEGGKFKIGDPIATKWADPKTEAGSVYSAGGALYTVSHSHVNAYIVWEELEAKLLERLTKQPGDFGARIELADVYNSIERFDQTLAELEKARLSAEKANAAGKSDEALIAIGSRKVETLMALGEKARIASKTSDAEAYLKKAYEASIVPGMADVLPVLALKAQAELYEGTGNLAGAVQTYQQMMAKHGNAVLQDKPQSFKMARLYAQMRQAELKTKDPASFAAVDAEASAALAGAGADAQKLESVIARYPNSEHAGTALLALARIELEKTPDRARLNAKRYLSRNRGAAETPLALAILAASCERLGLLATTHEALTRLASSDEFKDAKFNLQGIDSKAAAGDVAVREWAAKRLEEPLNRHAPSQAVFSMGQGKLSGDPVWHKTSVDSAIALIPDGIPPVEMRRAVFYIENANANATLSAVNGRDGLEMWKPRPVPPPKSRGRAFWWERLLIVCGESSIIAYDSAENGKVAWSQELKVERNSDTGYWAQIAGDRLIVSNNGNTLQGYDAASGGQLWRTQLTGSQMSFPPVCGDGFLVVATANSNKLTAYNLETGGVNWSADVSELKAAPAVSGDRIYVAQRTLKLSVFDGKTGKRISKDIDMDSPAIGLHATGDLAIASLENRELVAYRTDAQNPGKAWQVLLPPGSTVNEFFVDGDDLLVTSTLSPNKSELAAFSIKSQGKIKWKQEMATDAATQFAQIAQMNGVRINNLAGRVNIVGNGRLIIQNGQVIQMNNNDEGAANFAYGSDGSGGWLRENVAREGIVLMQSNWDISGSSSKVSALIDRATGKSVWDAALKSEQASDGTISPPRIQLFDGGLVLVEGHERKGYVGARAGAIDDVKDLAAQAAKNPGDADVRVKLATALYDKGEREKALSELTAMLADPKTSDAGFAAAYNQFATLRKDLAAQRHSALSFQRVEKAPDIAGGSAGWEAIPEKTFDGWLDVYLASEDLNSRTAPKKDAWRGPDDLKASFKGAYDDTNLYIQIAVKDDLHKNEQAEGVRIDFGDAVILAFDIDLSGGKGGYRGETFELALGLSKSGKAVGWRRVEHHKFLRGQTPLEKDFAVTRKENEKTTLYQLALPLEYLGLKPEAGKKFGFTFAVQDQDAGTAIDKSVCPSPGLIGTKEPRCFSHGVLEAKK